MALNWTNLQKTVYNLYKSQGFEITVRTPGSPGEYNADSRSYWGATSDTDLTTYALKEQYKISQIDGDTIQKNDTKLIFPAYGLSDVTPTNQILIDSVVQNVVDIRPVDPGNVTLLYEAQIRS